jgi:predicted lactoylglutathione lyase
MREDITPAALMLAAENKFNQITQVDAWEAKSKEEQQILALTAQLKAATDQMAQLSLSAPKKEDKARGMATKSNPSKKKEAQG